MSKKQTTPSADLLRKAYVEEYLKRKSNAQEIADFTEKELADFIRQYADANFKGIYAETDHNYYDRIIKQIPLNPKMKTANEAGELRFSSHLKLYSMFLESKEYKQLFQRKIVGTNEKPSTSAPSSTSSKPQEREMTEGEKKHVAYEVAHRNPALRQACLDKYGYQCQCCGMDFVSLYGEELGAGFIEVHHLKMISTFDESRPDYYVENLVPLCSNCHSMIHHGKEGPLTLGALRAAYKGETKELKIRKDD